MLSTSKKIYYGFCFKIFISGTLGMIGTTVYTATISQNVQFPESVIYEYGFWSAWGVVGIAYIAGLANHISARYMADMLDVKACKKNSVIKL